MLNLVYLFVLFLASPFLLYRAIRFKKYRDGWGQKFLGLVRVAPLSDEKKKRIWFHAVSVGEVNLLKPIIATIERERPEWDCVVSSTSKTGYELAQKLFADRFSVCYCPLDFTWAVNRALKRIKPDALVLVELELWPNLIRRAKYYGAVVAIMNGRVGDSSFRAYRRVRRALAPTFRRVDLILAQDERAANYFRALSPIPERVVVSGSIKFDGARTDRENPTTRALALLGGVRDEDVVFLCGSSQAPEEQGALETFRRLQSEFPQLKLFIAPRHKERFDEVAKILDDSEFPWTRRSTITEPLDANDEKSRVVLIDTIGELSAWWGVAKIAFVGGSWGSRGGQNMLEPAGFGVAVSFGPNVRNFRTIAETLLREDAARVAANVDETTEFVRECLTYPERRERLGANARNVTLRNAGAAEKTFDAIVQLLERR